MATIIESLRQWRSSFVNVRLVYEQWYPDSVDQGPSRSASDDRFHRIEWIWADSGAVRHQTSTYEEGRLDRREVCGYDGPKLLLFRATYEEERQRPGFLNQLKLQRMSSSEPKSIWGVLPLTQFYRNEAAMWMGDWLGEAKATLERYEEVDGGRCARVKARGQVFWLDPGHDFLVKRIAWRGSEGDTYTVFDVEEFQRVSGVWFPKRGWHNTTPDRPDELVRWLVTEVALNQSLDAKLFEPPAPSVGTLVVDARLGEAYRFGGKRARRARERQIAEQAKRQLSPTEEVIAVETFSSRLLWWSGLLLAVALALLLVRAGFSLWRRLRYRKA